MHCLKIVFQYQSIVYIYSSLIKRLKYLCILCDCFHYIQSWFTAILFT